MELVHTKIPREFLDRLPEGMKFIHRHGKEFLVVEEIFCPKGHSLMSDSVRIHGEPSIRIAVGRSQDAAPTGATGDPLADNSVDGTAAADRATAGATTGRGLIFVDAFWGSHAKLYSFFPQSGCADYLVDAHCPHCGVSMMVKRPCSRDDCDSDEGIQFFLPGENSSVTVCAKLGCPDHELLVRGLPSDALEAVSEINFFGHGFYGGDDDSDMGGI